jgi:hypothetical protein
MEDKPVCEKGNVAHSFKGGYAVVTSVTLYNGRYVYGGVGFDGRTWMTHEPTKIAENVDRYLRFCE